MKAFIRALIVLVVVVAIAGAVVAYSIARRGLSARMESSQVEELVARTMRGLATPHEVRSMTNPVEPTEAVPTEGLEHFADSLCELPREQRQRRYRNRAESLSAHA